MGNYMGSSFFDEAITAGKIIGAILVIIGVVIYAKSDGEKEDE